MDLRPEAPAGESEILHEDSEVLNAKAMLEYTTKALKAKKVGVLHDSGYGQLVLNALQSQSAGYGIEFVAVEKFEVGATDVHGIARRTGFGSLAAMLRHLDADIVCLQEHKLAALGAPERAVALAEGYDSFFSICRTSTPSTSFGRYAGVATFSRTACRPRRAEEGLTGVLATAAAS